MDFYDDEKEIVKKLEWLKDRSGIKSDTELGRWMITQLERYIKDDLKIREDAMKALEDLRKEVRSK